MLKKPQILKRLLEEIILTVIPVSHWTKYASLSFINQYGECSPYKNLFPWEENAINSFFPKPPAKIFVGAAGGGRELFWLTKLGYHFAFLEPIPQLALCAKSRVPKENLLAFTISHYEDLINKRIEEIEVYAPYDAVILSWSSFIHILDKDTQIKLLEKVRKLCPEGPILLSWFKDTEIGPKTRLFRKILSCLGLKTYTNRDFYTFELGPFHTFTKEEMISLIDLSGNSIAFYADEKVYPHAVLFPANSSKL